MIVGLLSTPFIGGLRRIVSGDSGHVEFDFLILVPYVLVVESLLLGFASRRPASAGRDSKASNFLGGAVLLLASSALASAVLSRALGADSIFRLVSEILLLLIAWAVAARGGETFWDKLRTLIPRVALVPAIYGVIQFFVLPEWDRRWMLAVSDTFVTIGEPYPFQVRVFGLSESPGSYAGFMAMAIVIGVVNAISARGGRNVIEWLIVLVLVPGLLLSGVRSMLLVVLLCVLVLALFRTRALQRMVLVGFIVVAALATQFVVSRFGGASSILTEDRYSLSGIGADTSLQARAQVWGMLSQWYTYVGGTPQPIGYDSYVVNVMAQYGLVAAVAVVSVLVVGAAKAVGFLVRSSSSTTMVSASLVTVFTFAGSFAGDPSYSLVAMIQFAAVGTVIAASPPRLSGPTSGTSPVPVKGQRDRVVL
jgi:hypothetical protein